MIYFLALIPATALTIAGYFVLYVSNRSEGAFRAFGKYLGFWAFTLAALVVLGAIFAAAHGGRGAALMRMREFHDRIHGFGPGPGEPRFRGPREGRPGPAPQPPQDAPSPPAPPPP
jgi:hypothetical protein